MNENKHQTAIQNLKSIKRFKRNTDKSRIRHTDLWAEINQSILLNCSLRVNQDQHVNFE